MDKVSTLEDSWVPDVGSLKHKPAQVARSQIPTLVKDLTKWNPNANELIWDKDRLQSVWEEDIVQ